MYRLYAEGLQPAAIRTRCQEGTAAVSAFDPPRKSVESIVKKMEMERGLRRRANFPEAFDGDTDRQLGNRMRRVLERELERIEAAQGAGKTVNPKDVVDLTRSYKHLTTASPKPRASGARSKLPANDKSQKRDGPSLLERLAAEQREEEKKARERQAVGRRAREALKQHQLRSSGKSSSASSHGPMAT